MLIGRRIQIVGGGIGGLAAAIALAQRGAHVSLLERAADIRDVGAGVQISPNGMYVLRALGVAEDLAARSLQGRAVSLRDGCRGTEVARLDLTTLPADQVYLFVHRADLISVLEAAARASGVTLELNAEVAAYEPEGHVQTDQGRVFEADVTIAADGLHSRARTLLNPESKAVFTGQVAWRAIIPNVTAHPLHARVHMGPGRHVVSYPLRDAKWVNLVAVQERDAWTEEGWHHQDDPKNMERAFAGFDAEVHRMMAAADVVHLWGLFRHPVAKVWHDGAGRLAMLGDAAHPTLPFLAQGANMALEDAWVLAAELAQTDTFAAGLAAYQARRQARVSRVVDAATGNAWKYHLRRGPIRWAAHTGLSLVSRLAPQRFLGQFDWLYRHDVTA